MPQPTIYPKYEEKGYLVLENFLSEYDIEVLKKECKKFVKKMDPKEHKTVFRCGDKQVADDYFMSSGDKIGFFFEEKAFNEKGDLIVDKNKALNKIGHALHWLNHEFKRVTFSKRVKEIAKNIGMIEPAVALSMYIFKHPRVASEVTPHQDATYIHTEPQNCVGFWLALEDATIENGCLWFIPGSHKGELDRRMIRNPDPNGPKIKYTGPDKQYLDDQFVPVPVPKGSLILIHGLVVHKSGINTTEQSRDIYSFHLVETHNTAYSNNNWLQPTDKLPFPLLYKTDAMNF